MAEILRYPFRTMKITQSYTGSTSHLPHTIGTPKDYPIDEGGSDIGKDPIYAPCDLKILRIYGVGGSGTNTIWLRSTDKVKFANGKSDNLVMMLTHSDDSDLKRLSEGQVLKKDSIICYEGADGASGNHLHISVGMGNIVGNGWTLNSKSKWVLNCTNGTLKPEECFFLDRSFTTVLQSGGLNFKEVSDAAKYSIGSYIVATAVLNVRSGASVKYAFKKFDELTVDAQNKIKKLVGGEVNGYVRGLVFTVLEIDGVWGRTPSGWVSLEYCKKI